MVQSLKNRLYSIVTNQQLSELLNCGFWSIMGTGVSKLALFLIWILVARLLTPDVYGEFSIIRSTTLLFSEFISLSIIIVATKYVAENLSDRQNLQRVVNSLNFVCVVLGMILAISLYFSSSFICETMMNAPHLYHYVAGVSVLMFFVTVNKCQFGILQGFGEFKLIAKINLLQVLLSFPTFYFCTKYWGLGGAVISYILYNVFIWLISLFFVRRKLKSENLEVNFIVHWPTLKKIILYVLPYFMAVLIVQLGVWYNEVSLVSLNSVGFLQLGNYSAAQNIQYAVIGVIMVMCTPFVSLMSKYKNDDDAMLVRMNYLMPMYLGLIFLTVIVLVPEVSYILYGSEYANSDFYGIIIIMGLYSPLLIFRASISRSVAVNDKQLFYLIDNVLMSIITVSGFYFFKQFGVMAMIGAIAFANLVSVLVFTPIYIHIKILDRNFIKFKMLIIAYLLFVAMGALSLLLQDNLLIRIVIVTAIYVVAGILVVRYIRAKNKTISINNI